jgi:hypothetical protein
VHHSRYKLSSPGDDFYSFQIPILPPSVLEASNKEIVLEGIIAIARTIQKMLITG